MDSWVQKHETLPRLPKGFGKGSGKQKSSEQVASSGGGRVKRQRLDFPARTDELAAVRELAECGAELGLRNSFLLRSLTAQNGVTLFVPSCSACLNAAAVIEEPGKQQDAFTQRWGQLVQVLAIDSKVPEECRRVSTEHAASIATPSELANPFDKGKVSLCVCKPTYSNSELFLVQIAVTEPLFKVASALVKSLVALGGSFEFGIAPRATIERRTTDALRHVRQFPRR